MSSNNREEGEVANEEGRLDVGIRRAGSGGSFGGISHRSMAIAAVGIVVVGVLYFTGNLGGSSTPTERQTTAPAAPRPAEMDIPSDRACVCCLSAPREVMFEGCAHLCLCQGCARTVVRQSNARGQNEDTAPCPMCRQKSVLRRVYC